MSDATPAGEGFATTRWTRVVAARGDSAEARQALSDLCALNYAPVLRYLRAAGHADDAARELAHGFFAGVLARHGLDGADPARGRFRSYLLGALKHFVAKLRVHGLREKRGGGAETVSLEIRSDTEHGAVPPALQTETPDALFDREWALGLIARTLTQLEQESEAAGTHAVFLALKPWLSASAAPPAQAEIAARLGMTDGALKVAIHRLRKRFRETVRREVAQTLADERDLDGEMQHLIAALAR